MNERYSRQILFREIGRTGQEKLFNARIKNLNTNMDLIKSLAFEYRTTLTATLRRFVTFTSHCCSMIYLVDGKTEESKMEYIRSPLMPGFPFPTTQRKIPTVRPRSATRTSPK